MGVSDYISARNVLFWRPVVPSASAVKWKAARGPPESKMLRIFLLAACMLHPCAVLGE